MGDDDRRESPAFGADQGQKGRDQRRGVGVDGGAGQAVGDDDGQVGRPARRALQRGAAGL